MNYLSLLPRQRIGLNLLRFGLAGVFLWFGFSQLFDSLNWISIVPAWATSLIPIPPAMIVLGSGLFEVVLGSLLVMGFFVRLIAFILALHLIPIALSFGFVATAIRDLGLVVSCLSLALLYEKPAKPGDIS